MEWLYTDRPRFPLFLFIGGVSVSLAIVPRIDAGATKAPIRQAAVRRALRIVGLGLLLNFVAWLAIPEAELRLPGVLQRIGICFAVAALLAVVTRPRAQDIVFVALLAVYGVVLLAGGMEPWTNLVSRVDAAVFEPFVYATDPAAGRGSTTRRASLRPCLPWRRPCSACVPGHGCAPVRCASWWSRRACASPWDGSRSGCGR